MATKPQSFQPSQAGFTLVELAIVLVIIGLIVGGVLVGQNLIKSAELRSTIGQIETYNTAISTFRGRYNALPGDINRAIAFGLGGANGNGNGLIQDAAGIATSYNGDIENFWVHLSGANMSPSVFTAVAATSPTVVTNFPSSKHGRGGIIVLADDGFNHYIIGANSAAAIALTGIVSNTLAPDEAFVIDDKMDDSKPLTGIVRAVEYNDAAAPFLINVLNNVGAVAGAANECGVNSDGVAGATNGDDYNTTLRDPVCVLRIRMN